ncbi:MAG: XRE family transcriptional regulator [Pseudomonadota bacterium]
MDGTGQAKTATVSAIAESLISLGSEVRQVRKARQMTLKDLAVASGISVSHLSAIERGAANPSIETVYGIADGLGITPDWFFARRSGAGPMEKAYVVRRQNRRNLNMLYGEGTDELGYNDALLSSSIGGGFYMGVADYEPHSSRPGHPLYQHGGEQHGLILTGEMELQIGDEFITLREGDSYSFPASIAHNARNTTDRPCKLVWAVSPVVIPRDVVVDLNNTQAAPNPAPKTARKRQVP